MPLPLALLRPAPLSTRLWQGAGIVGMVVLTIVVMNVLLPPEKAVTRTMLGHDFMAFYTAGTLINNGRAEELYDLSAARAIQRRVAHEYGLEVGEGFGPYWNPPFYAWAIAPLAAMPYDRAALAWLAINVGCAALALGMLCGIVLRAAHHWPLYDPASRAGPVPPWRYGLLVAVLACLSMPFLQALSHGQNTFISLLLLTAVVVLWRGRRAVAAGAVCGLLFYKPQLAAVVAAMLTVTLGWRALAGLVLTGLCLLGASELALPGSTALYAAQLPLNLAAMQVESAYLWERHATLKAFWRLLLQGREAGELAPATVVAWAATAALLGLGLARAAWNSLWHRTRVDDVFGGHTRALQLDRLIAAAIVAMPLLMPFYFDYDLLLLAIPFTLLAAERLRRAGEPVHRHDRLLVVLGALLYVWLPLNPGVARDGGVNATVVILAAVAGLFVARACRDRVEAAAADAPADRATAAPLPIAPPPRSALPRAAAPRPRRIAA